MEKLTTEQIEAKAKELSEREKCEVQPFVFEADEQIVGYLKEPTADDILYAGDTYLQGNYSSGKEQLLKSCLIMPESNERILNKTERRNARIYAAACREAGNMFQPYLNEYKKK